MKAGNRTPEKQTQKRVREERLATALRANLKKRKTARPAGTKTPGGRDSREGE